MKAYLQLINKSQTCDSEYDVLEEFINTTTHTKRYSDATIKLAVETVSNLKVTVQQDRSLNQLLLAMCFDSVT